MITGIPSMPLNALMQQAMIVEPQVHDVMLGRGVIHNNHPGNKRYKALVAMNKELYACSHNCQKVTIAKSIVFAVRSIKGRFLVKDDASGRYVDVGDNKATEKTLQALRDNLYNESAAVVDLTNDADQLDEGSMASIGSSKKVKQEGATSLLKWMCGVEDVLPVASLSQQSLNSSLTMKRENAQHSHLSPPAWISQPSPRQKRKARALRSYSLPTTVQEHAFVTIHRQPFEPTLQQYYSTPGLMLARPTLPTNVWQVQQHVPMPVPHYTVGSYHHCSQPQLACSAGETVISSVSTTLPAHHGQLPMQVPYTPSLNASIAYVPVIQYHSTVGATPITTPCPTASARPFRQSPTTLVGSTAENAEEINDSEDEERVGQIRSNDDDQLFPRLEPSHSRLCAGEGYYTPHGTPNDRMGGKPVQQRSVDTKQNNQQCFGLESHVKIGQEDDMPLPIDHEASWEISTLTDVENGFTHQTAPADLNGSGNFTPIDGDGLTGESLESFLRECPQELFEYLKP